MPSSDLDIHFLEAGHCKHPQAMALRGGRWKPQRFPASVAVLEHPSQGVILFDTGYSPRFFEQTRHFPERFYSLITPVTINPEQTAALLRTLGLRAVDVRYIILSHFHADHVAAAGDFPRARYVYMGEAYAQLKALGRWASVRAGFLRGLLPADFEARSVGLASSLFAMSSTDIDEFPWGHDLFGDGTLFLIPLPGHAEGHLGLLAHTRRGSYFLVADAAWSSEAIRSNRGPSRLATRLFPSPSAYSDTLSRLHRLQLRRPELRLVPCHCSELFPALSS